MTTIEVIMSKNTFRKVEGDSQVRIRYETEREARGLAGEGVTPSLETRRESGETLALAANEGQRELQPRQGCVPRS